MKDFGYGIPYSMLNTDTLCNGKRRRVGGCLLYTSNTGEGAATASRASFGKQLNDIGNYKEAQILAGDDGCNPVENGNVLLQNLKR